MPARPRKPSAKTITPISQERRNGRSSLGLDQLDALGAEGAFGGGVAGNVHAVAGVEGHTEVDAAVGAVDEAADADYVGAGLLQEVEDALDAAAGGLDVVDEEHRPARLNLEAAVEIELPLRVLLRKDVAHTKLPGGLVGEDDTA